MRPLLGLLVLAWPLTLLVLIGLAFVVVIPLARSYAARTGRSKRLWGWIGFFVVFLPIFWDWIPTVIAHQYYCATEAGFKVFKTVDQWKKENLGVIETLIDNSNSPNKRYPNWPDEKWQGKTIASINQRFGMLSTSHLYNSDEGELFINVWRWRTELLDKKTGEVLAQSVDFSTGNSGYLGGTHSPQIGVRS